MQQTSVEIIQPATGIRAEFLIPSTMTVGKAALLVLHTLADEYGLVMPEKPTPWLYDPVTQGVLPRSYTLSEAQVHHGSQLYLL